MQIFISYRREDSIGTAGRLADRLAETFGRDNLFMDVDSIPVGINFDEYLKSQVAACDFLLAVIGSNWLNAKDETDQRRLDKPDDFVAIELAAALARDIIVIPVLVDGTRMPKASELPASLKPFALRNAIQLRNANFGKDAEQLITKMREALILGRPQDPAVKSFHAHLVADFLGNISAFFVVLAMFFTRSDNFAAALAAAVAAMPIAFLGWRTLARDGRVRRFGLVICFAGMMWVPVPTVLSERHGLFESPTLQSLNLMIGIGFTFSLMFFYMDQYWKTPFDWTAARANLMRWVYSPWLSGLLFLLPMLFVSATWEILYRLTDSIGATLALVAVQLLVVGYCYVVYRQTLAANLAPSRQARAENFRG